MSVLAGPNAQTAMLFPVAHGLCICTLMSISQIRGTASLVLLSLAFIGCGYTTNIAHPNSMEAGGAGSGDDIKHDGVDGGGVLRRDAGPPRDVRIDVSATADGGTRFNFPDPATLPNDGPATHGMLLFGSTKNFVSHLPMFHAPHDYQVLAEVTFDATAQTALTRDRTRTGEKMYTFVPTAFRLKQILGGTTARPFRMTGSIVRGHFERGGTQIVRSATATVANLIVFRRLGTVGAADPAKAQYVLLGSASDTYAVHFIGARPDFDHVASVRGATALDDRSLALGALVTADTAPGGADLPDGTPVAVTAFGQANRLTLTTIYKEFAELE